MNQIRETTKGGSASQLQNATSASPIHFRKELYKLLFRNQKLEATIYGISLLTAFTYALFNHFVLGRPEKLILYEGSGIAISVFVVSALGYIYRSREHTFTDGIFSSPEFTRVIVMFCLIAVVVRVVFSPSPLPTSSMIFLLAVLLLLVFFVIATNQVERRK